MKHTTLSALVLLASLVTPSAALAGGTVELPRSALQSAPPTLELRVERDGVVHRLELVRHEMRRPDFRVRAWTADGTTVEVPPGPARTYRGTIAGDPERIVVAHLGVAGLTAWVVHENEIEWSIEPTGRGGGAANRRHAVIDGTSMLPASPCGIPADLITVPGNQQFPFPPQDAQCQRLVEIAYDADFEYYQQKGSTIQGVTDAIEAQLNLVDLFYARDLLVTFSLGDIIVRTAPFYAPTGGGNLLDLFRNEWNANQGAVQRDIAHLMTGKPGSLIEFGGLAYVSVACNLPWAYGWSMDGANTVGHEIGHNFGAPHCLDPFPCNTMCGGCLNVGPNTKDVMNAYLGGQTCLDIEALYDTPVPPFAHPDTVSVLKNAYAELQPRRIDVLANDEDGNCNAVRIVGFDTASALGGTVSLSPGTGADGRDELLYQAPSPIFVGQDTFGYSVGDGTGLITAGEVVVDVEPLEFSAYWMLDDGSGSTAIDTSPGGHHGSLIGTPVWTSGKYAGGLDFDGTDDHVDIPAMDLPGDEVTITAWIRRSGTQTPFSGLVYCRDGTTVAGLSIAGGNELRYTWDGHPSTWGFSTGLIVPDLQWVFVAVVVELDGATVYMHDGTLQSATNAVPHAVEPFDGVTRLGWDDAELIRRFVGSMDDVRIYCHALTTAQLDELAQFGGRAEVPVPPDGGSMAFQDGSLGWLASPLAVTHDVYFGTNHDAVRDATTLSPEFAGNQPASTYAPLGMVEGSRYFWRIDEVNGLDVVKGDVWQYELADSIRWRLDETSGTTAADSNGSDDGTYVGAPTLGQPGATPSLGTSITLDGSTQSVSIPALNLDGNRITMTAWVRPDTAPAWAGIVFYRSGNTVAGLNFGNANELRYHWNGGNWGWDSGLVVANGRWTFVALVVEPDQATIYTHDGVLLKSASNVTGHGPEEFDGTGHIGWDTHSNPRHFDGRIDDVHVFRKALSLAEIAQLYADSL